MVVVFFGCQNNDDNFVTIQGRVTDNTGTGLAGAAVVITSPAEYSSEFTSTDSTGRYVFGDLDITEATEVTIRASQTGFNTDTKSITALPEQIYNLNFELSDETTGGGGGDTGGGGDAVAGEPGLPAAIVLDAVSRESINIRQTGGQVSTTFSFTVQDSAGRSMDEDSIVPVNFRIINGPDGGESIVPTRVDTDDDGRVVTSLFSGDSAGVVRMEAYINRQDGAYISSSPILVAINGGFPAPNNFFVAPVNYNLEGYGFVFPGAPSERYSVTASVGDKFGNPVKVGTSVDFRTVNAGIISGSAATDENGFASVNFFPNGATPTGHPNGVGFFDVRAHTIDENNNDISKTVTLLFTTRAATITFESGSLLVPAYGQGTTSVDFSVTDGNGYPMAAGTQIEVTSDAGIDVTGDNDFTLGDYFTPGPGRTLFTVSLSNSDENNDTPIDAILSVTVTSPSGWETNRTF